MNDPITLMAAAQIFMAALIGAGVAATITIPLSISLLSPTCEYYFFSIN